MKMQAKVNYNTVDNYINDEERKDEIEGLREVRWVAREDQNWLTGTKLEDDYGSFIPQYVTYVYYFVF